MPNTLITPTMVAREAALALSNNLVLGNLVYRDYSDEFVAKGDTITVRKPATFEAVEFDGTTSAQDIDESSVAVKMDKHLDVSFVITQKELSLDIDEIGNRFIAPAARALANKVDTLIAGLYKDIPYYQAVSSTPSIADITAVDKILNVNKAPVDGRKLVLGPEANADYLALEQFVRADSRGVNTAIAEAELGRIYRFNAYMAQNIVSHTAGAGTVKVDLPAGYKAGDKTIHVDGVTSALKVGDAVTIGGAQYTIAGAGELATADQDITLDRGLEADVANDADVTLAGSGEMSMAFHTNAFALVTRPLAAPLGGAESAVINYNGYYMRVVMGWDTAKQQSVVNVGMLCGVKTLDPALACRLIKA